ncbi:unnamed protein product [Parnassius apollo]|uniref:(apollo) hypothetical protein n=1 Tax=Parnassius apollo TaxID=110799 RepID=A0A8S3WNS2_PARAO|nr:unnamed protein product [Parnassius apollo]
MNVLTYSEFCNIVGESILEKCGTVSSILESDDNFFAIYNLWQTFEAASENNNNYRINNDVDRGPFEIVEDNYVTDIIEDDETPRMILDEFTDHYVERIKAKQLKKIDEEAAKEERKRLREEKKKEKENSIPKRKSRKKVMEKAKQR